MNRTALLVMLIGLSGLDVGLASDVWVLQGNVASLGATGCRVTVFRASVLLHNSGAEPATVHALGVSEGAFQVGVPTELVVSPHTTVAVDRSVDWAPLPGGLVYILHLDVPSTVLVENRLEISAPACTPEGIPQIVIPNRGKAELPVFRSLNPAFQKLTFLGADLGALDARRNLTVYNAGSADAVAEVELRSGCDDSVVSTYTFVVPPNKIVTSRLENHRSERCPPSEIDSAAWAEYVVLTLSQPGFAYVSSIAPDPELYSGISVIGSQ